jgi:hypothetical protein
MTIVSKDWRWGPDKNTLDYSCSASIAAHGVAKIVDKGILLRPNSVRNFRWSGSYRVADESLPDDLLYDKFEDTAGRGGSWKSMRMEIRPTFGDTFVYGSTVISRAQVTGRLRRTIASGRVLRYRPYQSCSCFGPLTGTPILSI